jgi:putative ABC transport system ATP-binding protein
MTPLAPVLEASELYRFFHAGDDETFALRGVSLVVDAGEMVAIVGPSGSGKSTLLACLAGIDEPDGGRVSIAGEPISRRPEAERARLRARWVGVLQQSGNLVGHLTVQQNVELARSLTDRRGDAMPVDDLLDGVGLAERAQATPARLSGGEAARAGLAVSLANDPPLLLADEPTGEVGAGDEHLLLELFRERVDGGAAVVLVTHSEQAALVADRVVHLRDGRIDDV